MGATALPDYAIVIGITYTSNSGLKALAGTLRDATAFTEWLRAKHGGNVPRKNITSILSPEKQRSKQSAVPLKDQIDDALLDLGLDGTQKPIGRRLYFYFSGHGFGLQAGEICMLMARATSKELNANIGLGLYRASMRALAYFEEIVYVIDCCRNPSPPAFGVSAVPPNFTPPLPSGCDAVRDVVVAAAPAGFESFETTERSTRLRRGLFTMALLDVLASPIGVDEAGRHTVLNLERNLQSRVTAILASNGLSAGKQQPKVDVQPDPKADIVLVTPKIKPVPVRIVAPDRARGTLVVLENNVTPVGDRDAEKATSDKPPWMVKLWPTKLYSVRHTREDQLSSDAPIDWSVLAATSKDGEYVFVFPDA
jgi:hypothetical protein